MSGNLRTFRENPTSYNRTGIPCGDPSRYDSRGVLRMAPTGRPFKNQNLEAPVEDIETEGDRQLHELAKRQLETNVFIDGQLARKKSFTPSNILNPATSKVSGTLSVENYAKLEDHDKHLEELRQYGLSQDEIEILLETEGLGLDGKPAKRRRFGIDPTALASKLEHIKRKIEKKKSSLKEPDKFAGARYMSRHELDLERAISHNRDKSRLLGLLVTSASNQASEDDPNDPINNLDEIMKDVMEKGKKRGRGVRDMKPSFPVATCAPRPEGYVSDMEHSKGPLCPLCRLKITSHIGGGDHGNERVEDFCKCVIMNSTTQSTTEREQITEGPRKITSPVESIKEDVMIKNRLSVEGIKDIPRFKDYDPGIPTKILYVKNMSPRVTEEDLVSLFIRYQNPEKSRIIFKLMTGRMKGQAFITFDSTETATKALDLVNGYNCKGKHLVIQYGKLKS